jgi:hypothetical protein
MALRHSIFAQGGPALATMTTFERNAFSGNHGQHYGPRRAPPACDPEPRRQAVTPSSNHQITNHQITRSGLPLSCPAPDSPAPRKHGRVGIPRDSLQTSDLATGPSNCTTDRRLDARVGEPLGVAHPKDAGFRRWPASRPTAIGVPRRAPGPSAPHAHGLPANTFTVVPWPDILSEWALPRSGRESSRQSDPSVVLSRSVCLRLPSLIEVVGRCRHRSDALRLRRETFPRYSGQGLTETVCPGSIGPR